MTSVALDVPAMYADHHVVEVRRILSGIPGVETINASSAFQVVRVEFDPEKTSEEALRQQLDEVGYFNDLPGPAETGEPAAGREGTYFRHSAAYESAGTAVAFQQDIGTTGRPLWPCPGLGPVPTMDD